MANAELVSREKNIAHIKVTLEAAEVDAEYKRLFKEYTKDLKIPGFRKGKVPPNIVRQRIGEESLVSVMSEQLKDKAVEVALAKLELSPRQGQTDWDSDDTPAEGQPFSCEFHIPVLPDINLPDYRNFDIKVPKLEVSEAMKERYRQRLRERFTEFPQKDGAAAAGDAARFKFSTKYKDTDEPSPFAHDNMTLIIGKEGNLPGWDEQMTGKQAGDKFEFDYEMPKDFADPRVAGRNLAVSVEVTAVHGVQEPELDVDFIKQHLHLESIDEFENYITASLERERDAQFEQLKQELAMQKLTDELDVEVTPDMVSDELDGMVKDNDHQLRQYGSSLDQYLKDKGQELKEYRESLTEAAVRKIKTFLAIKKISEVEKLNVTTEDFRRYSLALMQQQGIQPDQFQKLMQRPEFMNEMAYQVIREKALAHLAASVKTVESEPDDENEPAAE